MYKGFPDVGVATAKEPLNYDEELRGARGAVQTFDFAPVQSVQIDLSAALRIAKHARDHQSIDANRHNMGRLCGLQFGDRVEVSLALPSPPAVQARDFDNDERRVREEEERLRKADATMLAAFDAENFGTYVVGHYAIAMAGSKAWFTHHAIKTLATQALNGHPAVLLVFDHIRSGELGRLHLRAFAPTAEFVACVATDFKEVRDLFQSANAQRVALSLAQHGVVEAGVLREVPVAIHTGPLQTLLLPHVQRREPARQAAHVATGLWARDYTMAMLDSLSRHVESLQSALKQHRNAGEGAAMGGTLDALLLLQQLRLQSEHISALCDSTLLGISTTRAAAK